MASLVVGLHSGIGAWRRVRVHQERTAKVQRALDQLCRDLRHLAIVPDQEGALVERASEGRGEILGFTALSSRRTQAAERGTVWSRIEYRIGNVEDEETEGLIRLYVPYVADSTMNGRETETLLLADVSAIHFDYVTADGVVPTWDDGGRLPHGLQITLDMASGPPITQALSIPAGAPVE
jgi:type II secretory pathway component PulJ